MDRSPWPVSSRDVEQLAKLPWWPGGCPPIKVVSHKDEHLGVHLSNVMMCCIPVIPHKAVAEVSKIGGL